MRRISITILLIIIFSITGLSQIKIGGQLGLNLSDASYSASDNYVAAKTKMKVFPMFGLLAEFKIDDHFFIQPEISYIPRGTEFDPLVNIYTGADMPGTSGTQTLDYLEIPILLKVKFGKEQLKPYVFFGPSIGILSKSEAELRNSGSTTTTENSSSFESTNIGLDFGGGVEYALNKQIDIFANLRYSMGLGDILKDDVFDWKTYGYQLNIGIKFCISGCEDVKKPVYVETPPPVIEKKRDRIVVKEYDLGKYDVPFFVSGYYRPNTTENLDNIYELRKGELKGATYIENFPKGSAKYDQYKSWSQQVENIFHVVVTTSNEEIFPMFKKQAGSSEVLEISVYGYADPRAITGKYQESETIRFEDNKGVTIAVNKGDDLDNLKLSGLRAYNTCKYLEQLFIQSSKDGKSDFSELKDAGKIQVRYIGAGVDSDAQNLEAQRRVKITFTRVIK
jgi:hypothetical protein